ncbi:MAG: hypothetical protein HND55_00170 [Pseudomonadota bacterium]|nr:MAG: hypothetical protein HND55_00170 [Pseudomonadota bacterium]
MPLAEALRAPWSAETRRWTLALPAATAGLVLLAPLWPDALTGLFTFVGVLAIWTLAIGHAARLLLALASGARTAAERAGHDVPPGLVGRMIVLWLIALTPLTIAVAGSSPGLAAPLTGAIVLVVLPLATPVLARTVSLIDALDPLAWRATLVEVGINRHLRLTAILAVMVAGYALLALILAPLPGWASAALQMLYWVWVQFAWFWLVGAALAAPRDDGRAPRSSPAHQAFDVDAEFKRLMGEGGLPGEHRRLADALLWTGETERAIAHGQHHVTALLEGFGRAGEAVEAADRLIARVPEFQLPDTESMYRLIGASRRHGHPGLTIDLCRNYLAAFPRSFKRDEIRLLACEAAAEAGPGTGRRVAGWLGELMQAELADDQRTRLKRILPYLDGRP